MNFFQRFKRYLFGFAIGIILTGVFFKERLDVFTSWLPANVVKNSIKEDTWYLSDKANCQFQNYKLDSQDIESLLEDGKVVFRESQTKVKPYEYLLRSKNRDFSYRIKMGKDSTVFMNIAGPTSAPECD